MQGDMKLRRIGNSLGTTFSKELLQNAGLAGDEELEVVAGSGEIRIRRASGRLVVEFTKDEANALASGNMETKAAEAALNKVRKLVCVELQTTGAEQLSDGSPDTHNA